MTSLLVADHSSMQALGERLAGQLVAGDLVVLSGELGAGKTTLTQGIGRGLGVRGDVTSPTYVIARVHPSTGDGPPLVHVDAYRLSSSLEVDDLDLDAALEDSVTVVEWGEGLVEGLAPDRLLLTIVRSVGVEPEVAGGVTQEHRVVSIVGVGDRWAGVAFDVLAGGNR